MTAVRFQPGQSGNPAGRPKGIPTKAQKFRAAIEEHVPGIVQALVRQALAGDVSAASLLLSRALPPLRPESQALSIQATATSLVERAEEITAATLAGEIPSSVGADLMGVLNGLARVTEIEDLAKRMDELEERMK